MVLLNICNPNKKTKHHRGFSLIEVTVVLALFAVVLSFGMSINVNAFRGDTFWSERSKIVSVLQRARSRAMANMFESAHGVCYIAPNYIIFRGTCVDGASTNESIPANVNIATVSDFSANFPSIIFDQLSGNINSAITIHITDGIKSADIIINNAGAINW